MASAEGHGWKRLGLCLIAIAVAWAAWSRIRSGELRGWGYLLVALALLLRALDPWARRAGPVRARVLVAQLVILGAGLALILSDYVRRLWDLLT